MPLPPDRSEPTPAPPPPLPVNEDGFRALAAALPQMIWVSGPQGGVRYMSPNWLEFTGCDEAGLLGDGIRQFVHPDDVGTLAKRRSDRGIQSTVEMVEFRLRRQDGVYRWFQGRVKYLHDADGQVEWAVGAACDTTDERETAALARERQEQLRVAVSVTGLARYALYPREHKLIGDERFSEIVGMRADELLDDEGLQALFSMVHPEDAPAVAQGVEASLAGGPDYDAVYRMARPTADGGTEQRWIAARGRAEFDAEGPVRVVGVLEDITDRRREEEARLQLQKREAIGTLASGIAHDFNNVISAILSNASLAEAEVAAGESPRTSLLEITRGARRAGDMVRRLLAISREEEPSDVAFDLGEVVAEACALVAPTLPRSVGFTWEIEGTLPPVVGDATQLHQVTMNLVRNADHAVGGRGSISVRVELVVLGGTESQDHVDLPPGRYLAIRVTDDGIGMSESLMQRVYDPFFTTKPPGEGTGLGLTACRRTVRNHAGEIQIRSEPNVGTMVVVYLPVAPQEHAPLSPPEAQKEAPRPGSSRTRVMFVDDEEALVRLASRAFPLAGFELSAFDDPAQALAAFVAEPAVVDVLVTDLSMPNLSGLELIQAVRELRPDLAVVLSSGYLTNEHRTDAEQLGVDEIVAKPCSIGDLTDAIQRVAGRAR